MMNTVDLIFAIVFIVALLAFFFGLPILAVWLFLRDEKKISDITTIKFD